MNRVHLTRPSRNLAPAQLRALVVMLVFVVAQAAGLFHLIEHGMGGDGDDCKICVIAAHAGHALVPEMFGLRLPMQVVRPVAAERLAPFAAAVPSLYASRAPPSFL